MILTQKVSWPKAFFFDRLSIQHMYLESLPKIFNLSHLNYHKVDNTYSLCFCY